MGPHGAQCSQFSNFWKFFFQKKYPKIRNVNFGCENQSCSHRNSAHFGTHTVSWGPLNDSFPDFQFFGSWIQDPGSRIQDPGSRIQDPGSRILDPGSRILDPASRILDPGSRILDPGSMDPWIHGTMGPGREGG